MSQDSQPYGYCQCGCGRKTDLARQTRRDRGWVKGEPKRFILGHSGKRNDPMATCSEDDCDRPVLARGMCGKHYQKWDREQHPGRARTYQDQYNERHPGRRAEQSKAQYDSDPARHITYARRSIVKRKYGLTLEEYDGIIARGCAICRGKGPRMALDHCHTSGKVRDALCTNCNAGLGQFKDDPARLRAAAKYLERHA